MKKVSFTAFKTASGMKKGGKQLGMEIPVLEAVVRYCGVVYDDQDCERDAQVVEACEPKVFGRGVWKGSSGDGSAGVVRFLFVECLVSCHGSERASRASLFLPQ